MEEQKLDRASTSDASGSRWYRHVKLHHAGVVVPLILMSILVSAYFITPSFYERLVVEDGPLEYATAAVYLISFALGLGLVLRLYEERNLAWAVLYAVMSASFLFVAMEEMSWGQRIFQINTPEFIEERNIQSEIGVHNLSGIRLLLHPAYIVVGFGGAFGSIILSLIGVSSEIRERLLPPFHLFLFFVPCFVFYLAGEIISPFTTIRYMGELSAVYGGRLDDPQGILALPAHILDFVRDRIPMWTGTGGVNFRVWRHQEPVEFLLSLGFLFFVIYRWGEETREPAPPGG